MSILKYAEVGFAVSLVFFVGVVLASTENSLQSDENALIAVFPQHFPPLYRTSENGVPSGFGIELMEAIAERADLRIHYRSISGWGEALEALAEGEADLIPDLGITPERAALFDFSEPLESIPIVMYVRADLNGIDSWQDVVRNKYMVGVIHKNSAEKFVKRAGVVHYRVFEDIGNALAELRNQGIDVVLYPQVVMEQLIRRLDLEESVRAVGEPVLTIKRAVAVRKGNRELLTRLNQVIKDFRHSSQYRDIYQRWNPRAASLWTSTRVVQLVSASIAAALLLGFMARLRLLRAVNRRLSAANAFNSAVLNSALEGIITIEANATLSSVNQAAERMFGATAAELLGQDVRSIFPTHQAERITSWLPGHAITHGTTNLPSIDTSSMALNAMDEGNHYIDSVALRKNGEQFPVRIGISSTEIGGKQRLVCTIYDMMEQRRMERQLAFLSDHDSLTGMLNPNGIKLVLFSLLNHAKRNCKPVACISLGIARFRHINEVYGRGAGEEVLAQVAAYLRQTLRASDTVGYIHDQLVARFGDDRFVLLLPDTGMEGSRALVERLLDGISRTSVQYGADMVHFDAKAGIACFPQHGDNEDELLSRADSALHNALESTVSKIRMFDAQHVELNSRIERSLDRVRSALVHDRILLHFQPIQNIATGKIVHYEVLLRLQDENSELIMPGEFIPVAERYGMIGQIDYRVLQLAFSHLAGMQESHPGTALAINLSAVHIGDDHLFAWLKQVFDESGILPQNVIFEITETAALKNLSHAKEFMEPLWALGCRFALDDFGVGFTSFAQLRVLPVDFVKIDGLFVRNLLESKEDQALVRAIIDIAHRLDKPVVAECVETQAVMEWLGRHGVDYAQGYWIGRPQADLLPQDCDPQQNPELGKWQMR